MSKIEFWKIDNYTNDPSDESQINGVVFDKVKARLYIDGICITAPRAEYAADANYADYAKFDSESNEISSTYATTEYVTTEDNKLQARVSNVEDNYVKLSDVFNVIYPIGSLYISADPTFDPNTSFSGTDWIRLSPAFLRATDSDADVGMYAGDDSITLTSANLPSHTHQVRFDGYTNYPLGYSSGGTVDGMVLSSGKWQTGKRVGTLGITPTGNGTAVSVMPYHLKVNMWKRIS